MAYRVAKSREEGLAQVNDIVNTYTKNRGTYIKSYNELQLRNEFVSPFLMALGWNVYNEGGKIPYLRDVLVEETIEIKDDNKRNPDYTLRVQGQRKFFLEAKKPSVDILNSTKAAFQTRRYGWNANLGISILCNFENLVIYDCRYKPDAEDDVRVARAQIYNFEEFIAKFDFIYDLISFESVNAGALEEQFSVYEGPRQTFDNYFLKQITGWREKLAKSAIQLNEDLATEDINFLIQRLLNRIVFLRICEDRAIEKHETLRKLQNYEQLKELFQSSDKKYNSGLFDFIEDNLALSITIDSVILIEIFNDLYYPLSPYDFSVVDSSILSQIYERFLGSHVRLSAEGNISIVSEPEVVISDGVVPTPKLIVDKIVTDTLTPVISVKTYAQISDIKILDMCCGSGTFLISVFDFMLKSIAQAILEEGIKDSRLTFELADGSHGLTLQSKRRILEHNIYGVDINPYAVEVSEFSLLLKLLEGESASSVEHYIAQNEGQILPDLEDNIKCGNSLVDDHFFQFMPEAIDKDELLVKLKPFNWNEEFPFLNERHGFDAIVGNPPYVRIQNLVKYIPEEIKYYQNALSGYGVASKETIDKYYVFIQRAISLLNSTGYLGYIVPHKFFINKGGKILRRFISENSYFNRIVHFGVTQVFPDKATYTAILVLQKQVSQNFVVKRISNINSKSISSIEGFEEYEQDKFSEMPWIFLSSDTRRVFEKIKSADVQPLSSLAKISVGWQTSKNYIFVFKPVEETETTYRFNVKGKIKEVEKGMCMPAIYKLSFKYCDTIAPNAQIIFPYNIENGKAKVMSEEFIQENYPLCWQYLSEYRAVLEARKINEKDPRWYQFGRNQHLVAFHNTPKLIWHVLSNKPTYIFDSNNIKFTGGGNGPYYGLINSSDYSIFYIMGILIHPLFERMIKSGASEFQGAYYSHGKQFLEEIPIKIIDEENKKDVRLYKEIVRLVENMIATKEKISVSYGVNRRVFGKKFSKLYQDLILAVNELYDLSEMDFNTVINDETLNAELRTDGDEVEDNQEEDVEEKE
jgi:methylase of polypeptide subunit release factors